MNGLEWVFIILYLNDDGEGATYKCGGVVEVSIEYLTFAPALVKAPGPDIIAGILSCWVGSTLSVVVPNVLTYVKQERHSCSDLNEDDWFQHAGQHDDASEVDNLPGGETRTK